MSLVNATPVFTESLRSIVVSQREREFGHEFLRDSLRKIKDKSYERATGERPGAICLAILSASSGFHRRTSNIVTGHRWFRPVRMSPFSYFLRRNKYTAFDLFQDPSNARKCRAASMFRSQCVLQEQLSSLHFSHKFFRHYLHTSFINHEVHHPRPCRCSRLR